MDLSPRPCRVASLVARRRHSVASRLGPRPPGRRCICGLVGNLAYCILYRGLEVTNRIVEAKLADTIHVAARAGTHAMPRVSSRQARRAGRSSEQAAELVSVRERNAGGGVAASPGSLSVVRRDRLLALF
eukprot:2834703-Prymnesium_polylepis.1